MPVLFCALKIRVKGIKSEWERLFVDKMWICIKIFVSKCLHKKSPRILILCGLLAFSHKDFVNYGGKYKKIVTKYKNFVTST